MYIDGLVISSIVFIIIHQIHGFYKLKNYEFCIKKTGFENLANANSYSYI